MYILVNVERHKNVMGEIVQNLVSEYGVPVSIVDNIQKVCPKCILSSCSFDESMKSEETSEHDNKNPKLQDPSAAAAAAAAQISMSSRSSISSTIAQPATSSTPRPPSAKKCKIDGGGGGGGADEILEIIENESTSLAATSPMFADSQAVFESAIAHAFQTSHHDFGKAFGCGIKAKASAISDDASNSSNMDMEDDDYANNVCLNPQLLASFISSTPNIFASTTDLSKLTSEATSPSTSSTQNGGSGGKRDIPPNLTVNGKTRRGRIVYTQNELNILEQYYLDDPNACADPTKRDELCKVLDIDYHRLKVWFQNRRRKDKIRLQMEEETNGVNVSSQAYQLLRDTSASPQRIQIKPE